MNIHLVKLGTSFVAGTVATAGLVRLIYWAPLPSYMKLALAIVVPVPSIAIALVLLYYGPQAGSEDLSGLGAPRGWLIMFLYGCLATLAYYALSALWRMFQPPAERADESEDIDE